METDMSINMIMATDNLGGIGKNNGLPWGRHDEDMKWFRDKTLGHVVLMGRTTFESLGSVPLPGRINVVMSNTLPQDTPGVKVVQGSMWNILADLKRDYPDLKIWIIGGKDVYQKGFRYAEKMYITTIKGLYGADTYIDLDVIDYLFPVCT